MNSKEDIFFINQTIEGNTKAFASLVDKYKNYVYTISYRILKNAEDAEENAQDSFLKVYKNIKSFKQNSKFSTWLYTIAFRNAISKSRKKIIETTEISEQTIHTYEYLNNLTPFGTLKSKEQRKYIDLALDKLSGMDCLLLTLFYLNENTVEEIHQITKLSVSNVKVKLYRSRKKLHEELHKILKGELKSII